MPRPRVVVAAAFPVEGLKLLRERFVVDSAPNGAGRASLLARVAGAAAIVSDPSVPVDGPLLDAAGEPLVVVANFGVGYDNIDLAAARIRGVRVTNTPEVLTDATAELAVTLMLAAGRRVAEGDAIVRGGKWDGGPDQLIGYSMVGATVGLIGFGRIGRRVARLLGGFDARVLYTGPGGAPPARGAERRELDDLLGASDFVSLHVPLTPETRHLIGAGELARIKPGAVLVNTSRGAVIDTAALIEALRTGRLAAAGLDVYEDEPVVPQELRELPNTVLLPHIGSAVARTRAAMARLCAENVIAVLEGRDPPTAVV